MGQSWSTSGEHIEGIMPLDEMTIPPPNGVKHRWNIRLDANRQYPFAGDSVSEMIRVFLDGAKQTQHTDDTGLPARKDPYQYAGLVLLKENDAQIQIVKDQIDLAQRRILPGLQPHVLSEWMEASVLYPVGDGAAERMISEGSTVVAAEGLPNEAGDHFFDIKVMVIRHFLERAHFHNMLVGVGISIDRLDIGGVDFKKWKLPSGGQVEYERILQVCGEKVRMIQDFYPEKALLSLAPRTPIVAETSQSSASREGAGAAVTKSPAAKESSAAKTSSAPKKKSAAAHKSPEAEESPAPKKTSKVASKKKTATKTSKEEPQTSPKTPSRKRKRESDPTHSDRDPCTPPSTPTKKRSRVGAIPWTEEEKKLCVHFYWEHYSVKKREVPWTQAAELWCSTFNRNDTAVQLESSRRRFESLGIVGSGEKCSLCAKDESPAATEEQGGRRRSTRGASHKDSATKKQSKGSQVKEGRSVKCH